MNAAIKLNRLSIISFCTQASFYTCNVLLYLLLACRCRKMFSRLLFPHSPATVLQYSVVLAPGRDQDGLQSKAVPVQAWPGPRVSRRMWFPELVENWHTVLYTCRLYPHRRYPWYSFPLEQRFSTFVRPRPGKFFFHKTRARSQQTYSSVPSQFFFKFNTLN